MNNETINNEKKECLKRILIGIEGCSRRSRVIDRAERSLTSPLAGRVTWWGLDRVARRVCRAGIPRNVSKTDRARLLQWNS